jgi:hypothetical protein
MKIKNLNNSKLDTLEKVHDIISHNGQICFNLPFFVAEDFLLIYNFSDFKYVLSLMIKNRKWYVDICGDLSSSDISNICKIDYEYTKWNCIENKKG